VLKALQELLSPLGSIAVIYRTVTLVVVVVMVRIWIMMWVMVMVLVVAWSRWRRAWAH
jgi:hypothetical protein